MSMICLGILPVESGDSPEMLKAAAEQICNAHHLFCYFDQACDISEPCLKRYKNSYSHYLVYSIADHPQYNNIEDFFAFASHDGIDQGKIQRNAAVLSDIIQQMTDSCHLKECHLFIALSGALYEELDLLQVDWKTCSRMLEKALLQSALACEDPYIHIVYRP